MPAEITGKARTVPQDRYERTPENVQHNGSPWRLNLHRFVTSKDAYQPRAPRGSARVLVWALPVCSLSFWCVHNKLSPITASWFIGFTSVTSELWMVREGTHVWTLVLMCKSPGCSRGPILTKSMPGDASKEQVVQDGADITGQETVRR